MNNFELWRQNKKRQEKRLAKLKEKSLPEVEGTLVSFKKSTETPDWSEALLSSLDLEKKEKKRKARNKRKASNIQKAHKIFKPTNRIAKRFAKKLEKKIEKLTQKLSTFEDKDLTLGQVWNNLNKYNSFYKNKEKTLARKNIINLKHPMLTSKKLKNKLNRLKAKLNQIN